MIHIGIPYRISYRDSLYDSYRGSLYEIISGIPIGNPLCRGSCSLSNVDREGVTELQRLWHVCMCNFMSFTSYAFSVEYVLHGTVIKDRVYRQVIDSSGWNISHVAGTRHISFLENFQ